MSKLPKQLVLGSAIVTLLVAVMAIADFAIAVPFGGAATFDIMLILGSVAGLYLCWDSWQDIK